MKKQPINEKKIPMEVLNESQLIVSRNKLIIYESLIDQKVKAYEMIGQGWMARQPVDGAFPIT